MHYTKCSICSLRHNHCNVVQVAEVGNPYHDQLRILTSRKLGGGGGGLDDHDVTINFNYACVLCLM